MAKYRFECPECGALYEQESPIERGPVPMDCPDCAYEDLRVVMKRVWNAVPAIFRGNGWAGKS